jgi:hypothetical protein
VYLIPRPRHDPRADFDDFCTRRSAAARRILDTARTVVIDAASSYEDAYSRPDSASAVFLTADQKRELINNYKLTESGRPFFAVRQRLLAEARRERCPLCGLRSVATLDHHLPKSVFPEFSTLLANLVPCCHQCNLSKRDVIGTAANGRFFHPYFDTLPDYELLVADVFVSDTVVVTYRVEEHLSGAGQEMARNIKFHFDRLDLATHFEAEANQEIFDHLHAFRDFFKNGGAEGLAGKLETMAMSVRLERGINSWKTALYNSLARSTDFCAGGFALLASSEWLDAWL